MHNKKFKPWIYPVIEKVTNLSLFIAIIYFLTYFISINQGLSRTYQLNLINIISYISIIGIIFSILSVVAQILKGNKVIFTIGKLLLAIVRSLLLLLLFIVINIIYTFSF